MKWSELMEANYEAIIGKMIDAFVLAEGGDPLTEEAVAIRCDGDVYLVGAITKEKFPENIIDDHNIIIDRIPSWYFDYDLADYLAGSEYFSWILAAYNAKKTHLGNGDLDLAEFMKENHYAEFNHWRNTIIDNEKETFEGCARRNLIHIIARQKALEAKR